MKPPSHYTITCKGCGETIACPITSKDRGSRITLDTRPIGEHHRRTGHAIDGTQLPTKLGRGQQDTSTHKEQGL